MDAYQHKLTDYNSKNDNFYSTDSSLLLYRYLIDGNYPTKASKLAGISKQKAHYHIKKWLKQGLLIKIGKNPTFYKEANNEVKTFKAKGLPLLPHRFGASYWIRTSKNNRNYKNYNPVRSGKRGKAKWMQYIWTEGDFTILANPNIVQIWCHCFNGKNVQDRITNGYNAIAERIKDFAIEQNIKLSFYKRYKNTEYILKNKELSKAIAKILDIEDSDKIIADTNFTYDDKTHEGYLELNGKNATETAKTLEWLLTDARRIIEEQAKAIKALTEFNSLLLENLEKTQIKKL